MCATEKKKKKGVHTNEQRKNQGEICQTVHTWKKKQENKTKQNRKMSSYMNSMIIATI